MIRRVGDMIRRVGERRTDHDDGTYWYWTGSRWVHEDDAEGATFFDPDDEGDRLYHERRDEP